MWPASNACAHLICATAQRRRSCRTYPGWNIHQPGYVNAGNQLAYLPSALPFLLQDVTYSVKNSQNRRETLSLLRNVDGYLAAGDLTALMGPSGSGKTTLLVGASQQQPCPSPALPTDAFAGHMNYAVHLRRGELPLPG